jgi:DNA-binding LytR/AlgR family response regulator
MTCIVVNDEPLARNAIKTLINQTENLTLLASFNNTFEASRFISEHTVDLVFFDIQIDETNGYEFIKVIPHKTFVIFISEISSTAIRTYKTDVIVSLKSARFQKGIDLARKYFKVEKKENSNIADDYFVI